MRFCYVVPLFLFIPAIADSQNQQRSKRTVIITGDAPVKIVQVSKDVNDKTNLRLLNSDQQKPPENGPLNIDGDLPDSSSTNFGEQVPDINQKSPGIIRANATAPVEFRRKQGRFYLKHRRNRRNRRKHGKFVQQAPENDPFEVEGKLPDPFEIEENIPERRHLKHRHLKHRRHSKHRHSKHRRSKHHRRTKIDDLTELYGRPDLDILTDPSLSSAVNPKRRRHSKHRHSKHNQRAKYLEQEPPKNDQLEQIPELPKRYTHSQPKQQVIYFIRKPSKKLPSDTDQQMPPDQIPSDFDQQLTGHAPQQIPTDFDQPTPQQLPSDFDQPPPSFDYPVPELPASLDYPIPEFPPSDFNQQQSPNQRQSTKKPHHQIVIIGRKVPNSESQQRSPRNLPNFDRQTSRKRPSFGLSARKNPFLYPGQYDPSAVRNLPPHLRRIVDPSQYRPTVEELRRDPDLPRTPIEINTEPRSPMMCYCYRDPQNCPNATKRFTWTQCTGSCQIEYNVNKKRIVSQGCVQPRGPNRRFRINEIETKICNISDCNKRID